MNLAQQAVDGASLRCADALPAKLIASSRTIGWTSLLVDYQRVVTAEEPFETVPTPDQTIVVMTRGEQELESYHRGAWRRATYRAGTVGLTPGATTDRLRRWVRRDAGPARKANIYVPRLLLEEVADHFARAGSRTYYEPPAALGFPDAMLQQFAVTLLRAVQAGLPDLYAESAARWLAIHLLSFRNGDRPACNIAARRAGEISDKRLARVLDFMETHLAERLSLDALAAEAGVSKFHFVRLFRNATGVTPHRWLVDRRLDAARQLLATTDASLAQIAARCGFPRSNHFATQFAARFGMSPAAYRLAS